MTSIKSFAATFVFFTILLRATTAFSGGYSVGNGGDGIDTGEHLYVRDLFQAGVAENPFVGTDVDAWISARLGREKFDGEVPTDVLARKLTDLNTLSGDTLGAFVLEAIAMYDWRWVDVPLKPVQDDGSLDPILDLGSVSLVQLAVRLGPTIYVNLNGWRRLTPEHRAALMIHEGLYSVLVPDSCDRDSVCSQNPHFARELTGLVFKRPDQWNSWGETKHLWQRRLSVPLGEKLRPNEIAHKWILQEPGGKGYQVTEPINYYDMQSIVETITPVIVGACQDFEAHVKSGAKVVIESRIESQQSQGAFVEYRARFGDKVENQLRVEFGFALEALAPTLRLSGGRLESSSKCEAALGKQLKLGF